MRNKCNAKMSELYKKEEGKETYQYIVWATQMPNSSTNNIPFQRLRTTGFLHANTNTEEGLCAITNQ